MQASQCTTTPRAGAIFRQKSGRGFLRFSLSFALFPPFPFFRLFLFSAFPSFPRFFKKQKPLRRREGSKPTDAYQHFNFKSCHPPHAKRAIPYSEGLRLKRVCNSENAFEKRLGELKRQCQ